MAQTVRMISIIPLCPAFKTPLGNITPNSFLRLGFRRKSRPCSCLEPQYHPAFNTTNDARARTTVLPLAKAAGAPGAPTIIAKHKGSAEYFIAGPSSFAASQPATSSPPGSVSPLHARRSRRQIAALPTFPGNTAADRPCGHCCISTIWERQEPYEIISLDIGRKRAMFQKYKIKLRWGFCALWLTR
jgi:hypothetical protein